MTLHLPDGKRLAVSIAADFDAHSLWMGTFDKTTPGFLSRGEFCAEVGVPRLLELFDRFGITTTWCTPTHTMQTFTRRFESILDAGHEIAAHGCWHEPIPTLEPHDERRLMEITLELHQKYVGKKPRGYRSPAWDFTNETMTILEENGFEWDSSLMGRDFEPYYPRPVTVGWENGNTFGAPSSVLEFPVSWFLDDFPATEFVPGGGLGSGTEMFQRFTETFDYAYEHAPGGVLAITVHPQTIGRAHLMVGLEKLLAYMSSHSGTWFAPLSDIFDTWNANN